MVQYYRDLWARQSEILSPLTNLVGECGHTKARVVLAYPDCSQGFEIYTDSSKFQLGAVNTQNNRPWAFFSCKPNTVQQKYSVTKQELLAIVERLKVFKGML